MYILASVDGTDAQSRSGIGSTSGEKTAWDDKTEATLKLDVSNSNRLTLEIWNSNYVNDTKITSTVLTLSTLAMGKTVSVKMANNFTMLCIFEFQLKSAGIVKSTL